MIDEGAVRKELYNQFIQPTNQKKNFIGIEIEIPIVNLDKKAVEFLVAKGSDDAMGARPLRRAVQHHVEDPLADLLLRGTLVPGRIKVSTDKDESALVFKQQKRS